MMQAVWSFLWGEVPWEVWLGIGVAATLGVTIMVPRPFGTVLGVILAALTFGAAGYSRGVAWEKAYWEATMRAKQEAFDAKIATLTAQEAMKAANQERRITELHKELVDVLEQVAKDPGAGNIVIPEPVARSLYNRSHPRNLR